MMNKETETPEDFAARALEVLEQTYAYYAAPLKQVTKAQARDQDESYFEYVKAA